MGHRYIGIKIHQRSIARFIGIQGDPTTIIIYHFSRLLLGIPQNPFIGPSVEQICNGRSPQGPNRLPRCSALCRYYVQLRLKYGIIKRIIIPWDRNTSDHHPLPVITNRRSIKSKDSIIISEPRNRSIKQSRLFFKEIIKFLLVYFAS